MFHHFLDFNVSSGFFQVAFPFLAISWWLRGALGTVAVWKFDVSNVSKV